MDFELRRQHEPVRDGSMISKGFQIFWEFGLSIFASRKYLYSLLATSNTSWVLRDVSVRGKISCLWFNCGPMSQHSAENKTRKDRMKKNEGSMFCFWCLQFFFQAGSWGWVDDPSLRLGPSGLSPGQRRVSHAPKPGIRPSVHRKQETGQCPSVEFGREQEARLMWSWIKRQDLRAGFIARRAL